MLIPVYQWNLYTKMLQLFLWIICIGNIKTVWYRKLYMKGWYISKHFNNPRPKYVPWGKMFQYPQVIYYFNSPQDFLLLVHNYKKLWKVGKNTDKSRNYIKVLTMKLEWEKPTVLRFKLSEEDQIIQPFHRIDSSHNLKIFWGAEKSTAL